MFKLPPIDQKMSSNNWQLEHNGSRDVQIISNNLWTIHTRFSFIYSNSHLLNTDFQVAPGELQRVIQLWTITRPNKSITPTNCHSATQTASTSHHDFSSNITTMMQKIYIYIIISILSYLSIYIYLCISLFIFRWGRPYGAIAQNRSWRAAENYNRGAARANRANSKHGTRAKTRSAAAWRAICAKRVFCANRSVYAKCAVCGASMYAKVPNS